MDNEDFLANSVGYLISENEVYMLREINERIKRHYNEPLVAPNGKAEGLCLCVAGLKGIVERLMTSKPYDFNSAHPKKEE